MDGSAKLLKSGHILYRVRQFAIHDVSSIETILAESPEAAAWSRQTLEEFSGNDRFAWVIESDGGIVGFLAGRTVADDEAEILNLAVATTYRRGGAATELLRVVVDELTRLQIRKLHLEVRESNRPAISLYEKNGFIRCGRRPNYYRQPDEAGVLLAKELTG